MPRHSTHLEPYAFQMVGLYTINLSSNTQMVFFHALACDQGGIWGIAKVYRDQGVLVASDEASGVTV